MCMRRYLVISMVLAAGSPLALGQVIHEAGPYDKPGSPNRARVSPAAGGLDNLTAQVNVNSQGLNIVGDAANEPSMAVDPTAPNRLAIGWRQFDTIGSNFRQAGRAYSRDGGRTWINPGPLDPGIFRSDPVLRADKIGRFYYLSLTNTGPGGFSCQLFTSLDGGATFGPAVEALGGDKSWCTVDVTNSSGAGFLYQAWSLGGVASQAFTRSTNLGVSWLQPTVSPVPVWGTLDTNAQGDLFIAGIPSAGSTTTSFRVARSTDAKFAVSTPTFTTFNFPMGGNIVIGAAPNPGGLLGQASIAVDRSGGPRHGWIYVLCSVDPAGGDPMDVMFQRSTDGGQTWLATPIRVNTDPQGPNNWNWFGTMSVGPNGRIDAVWNDTRESLNATLCRTYYASSNDGGATWQGHTPITPQWNSIVGHPNQNKIGDYYDMWSDRVGAFLAMSMTPAGEQDVFCIRIGGYDCNGNGIDDTTDIATGTPDCNANGIPDSCETAAGVPVNCAPCYPNCDASTTAPVLTPNDFGCFLNAYASGFSYANCDGSTVQPVLTANDFQCFLNSYAAGCS
jgi:hypothetical protein